MDRFERIALRVLIALCLVLAVVCLAACSHSSSTNGRETWILGLGKIQEGKSDTVTAFGDPATEYAKHPRLHAAESDAPSDSIRAIYGGSR
jgi:hypothetical protein